MVKKKVINKSIEKIIVSVGLGKLRLQGNFEDKVLPEVMKELALVTGQKAAPRKAKKSIAGFKTRQGDIIGLQVTLRGQRAVDFLSRLSNVVIPRLKDFRGINLKNIDQGGSLNIGFRDQFVFPEIDVDNSLVNFGLQVTVVPQIRGREAAIDLYRDLGVPLKK